jgi:hypothetical protein
MRKKAVSQDILSVLVIAGIMVLLSLSSGGSASAGQYSAMSPPAPGEVVIHHIGALENLIPDFRSEETNVPSDSGWLFPKAAPVKVDWLLSMDTAMRSA